MRFSRQALALRSDRLHGDAVYADACQAGPECRPSGGSVCAEEPTVTGSGRHALLEDTQSRALWGFIRTRQGSQGLSTFRASF